MKKITKLVIAFVVSQIFAFYFNFLYTGSGITFGTDFVCGSFLLGYLFVFFVFMTAVIKDKE